MTIPVMPDVRALHLLPHQGIGGVQRFVIEFVRHERMDGAQDEIILTRRPLDVDSDFLAPATPVHFLGLTGEKLKVRAQRLRDLATSRSARVLQVYQAEDLALAVEASRLSGGGLKVVTMLFDGPEGLEEAGGLLGGRRLRAGIQAVEAFFVASPALVLPWTSRGAAPETRLAAVDIQRFHPEDVVSSWRNARLPDPDTLLVGSLMRAVPGKGHDALIRAVEERHGAGRPTALMLVGDGPRFAELQGRAKDSPSLFVRRRVLDSPGFFGRIDAFALHSESEKVPMALVESLASGRAATVADPGGVAEFVGKDAALFTRPGDTGALVAALDQLADPEFRIALGETARQRALERHNLGRLRGQLAPEYA